MGGARLRSDSRQRTFYHHKQTCTTLFFNKNCTIVGFPSRLEAIAFLRGAGWIGYVPSSEDVKFEIERDNVTTRLFNIEDGGGK